MIPYTRFGSVASFASCPLVEFVHESINKPDPYAWFLESINSDDNGDGCCPLQFQIASVGDCLLLSSVPDCLRR